MTGDANDADTPASAGDGVPGGLDPAGRGMRRSDRSAPRPPLTLRVTVHGLTGTAGEELARVQGRAVLAALHALADTDDTPTED